MWSQTTQVCFGQLVRTALVGSLMRGAGGALFQCYAVCHGAALLWNLAWQVSNCALSDNTVVSGAVSAVRGS